VDGCLALDVWHVEPCTCVTWESTSQKPRGCPRRVSKTDNPGASHVHTRNATPTLNATLFPWTTM
jgi:hypothetical protein